MRVRCHHPSGDRYFHQGEWCASRPNRTMLVCSPQQWWTRRREHAANEATSLVLLTDLVGAASFASASRKRREAPGRSTDSQRMTAKGPMRWISNRFKTATRESRAHRTHRGARLRLRAMQLWSTRKLSCRRRCGTSGAGPEQRHRGAPRVPLANGSYTRSFNRRPSYLTRRTRSPCRF